MNYLELIRGEDEVLMVGVDGYLQHGKMTIILPGWCLLPGTHLHILLGVGDQRAVAGAAVAREALLPVTRQACVVAGIISTLSTLLSTID